MRNSSDETLTILLCTYNGVDHLSEQLNSFDVQTYKHWRALASDDLSQDDTISVLMTFQQMWPTGKLTICTGPGLGHAKNFLNLVCDPTIDDDYFAYADQDDIWDSDKLERALDWLRSINTDIPALYCSRTELVDSSNSSMGLSSLCPKPPSFQNALVQCIAGGNTMVFNRAARSLLVRSGRDIAISNHDWWTYMLVSGCGGKVFYDRTPTVKYRQHSKNTHGKNTHWRNRITRIRLLLNGAYKRWNDENISALIKLKSELTSENTICLDHFIKARKLRLGQRLWHFAKSGVHRQDWLGNLGLIVAVIFRKL